MALLKKLNAIRSRHNSPSLEAIGSDGQWSESKNPYWLSISLESPPLVLYGAPEVSSGYLLSGLLFLNVPYKNGGANSSVKNSPLLAPVRSKSSRPSSVKNSPMIHPVSSAISLSGDSEHSQHEPKQILINDVTLSLNQIITYGKPFLPPSNTLSSCSACKTKTTVLARWDVLSKPTTFTTGEQAFPFSHLLPGSLPQTCVLGSTSNFTVRYELVARSTSIIDKKEKVVQVKLPLRISRSVMKGPDKNSLRIFPPSNVTVTATIPNVVYPKASFIAEIRADGLNENDKRWRMRRMTWRLEESVQVRARSCDLGFHKTKLKVLESNIRLNHEDKTSHGQFVLGLQISDANQHGQRRLQAANGHGASSTSSSTPSETSTNIHQGPVNEPDEGDDITPSDEYLHPEDPERLARRIQNETNTRSEDKDLYLQEVRVLEKGSIREGWKSDYSGTGTLEMPVEINCKKLNTGLVSYMNKVDSRFGPSGIIDKSLDIGTDVNCSCDISDPESGIYVSHTLILEANLAEEIVSHSHNAASKNRSASAEQNDSAAAAPSTSAMAAATYTSAAAGSAAAAPTTSPHGSKAAIPTGITRLFRMRFKVILTERSGFGVSWDEEVPPQYSQVSTFSPPSYGEAVLMDEELVELQI